MCVCECVRVCVRVCIAVSRLLTLLSHQNQLRTLCTCGYVFVLRPWVVCVVCVVCAQPWGAPFVCLWCSDPVVAMLTRCVTSCLLEPGATRGTRPLRNVEPQNRHLVRTTRTHNSYTQHVRKTRTHNSYTQLVRTTCTHNMYTQHVHTT